MTTTDTIFTFNETNYKPLDFAYKITEADVNANLSETVICLENDLNCYIPLEIVTVDTDTADKTVKCLWSWCYIVGDPYSPDYNEPDNNETTSTNLTLCLD